jgi:archaellum component FlaC
MLSSFLNRPSVTEDPTTIGTDAYKSEIEAYINHFKEKTPKLSECIMKYIEAQTEKIKILSSMNLKAEIEERQNAKKFEAIDERINSIKNRNKDLRSRIVKIMKDLDTVGGSSEIGIKEMEVLNKIEEEGNVVGDLEMEGLKNLMRRQNDKALIGSYKCALKTMNRSQVDQLVKLHNQM